MVDADEELRVAMPARQGLDEIVAEHEPFRRHPAREDHRVPRPIGRFAVGSRPGAADRAVRPSLARVRRRFQRHLAQLQPRAGSDCRRQRQRFAAGESGVHTPVVGLHQLQSDALERAAMGELYVEIEPQRPVSVNIQCDIRQIMEHDAHAG
jgi:hypothetical protein